MTFIFKPSARSATIEPTLPQPMMPSVLPKISTPRNLFFSHLPARVELSASGICRANASISEIACSAVVIELPNGVFITMMPRAVAAAMSTLSVRGSPRPADCQNRGMKLSNPGGALHPGVKFGSRLIPERSSPRCRCLALSNPGSNFGFLLTELVLRASLAFGSTHVTGIAKAGFLLVSTLPVHGRIPQATGRLALTSAQNGTP